MTEPNAVSPAYPNGQCPACGWGLTDEGACDNDTCSNYGQVMGEPECPAMTVCAFCREPITLVDGVWVDATDGDCCSGDDNLNNENESHEPECPAGGPHTWRYMTAWEMGPGWPQPTGFYCSECHAPAPEKEKQ